MNEPIDLKEGEILAGKYRVERVLAQGGMGVVVAAIHQQLDQRLALKFLLPDGVQNEAHVARFVREARAAVRLRSEHVARVLDVGTSETGSPYIVMEYLEGQDLSNVLAEKGALPVHTAVGYILQACEAVAEAHANGIVHRDLKPANLFLTKRPDGTACIKVLDFGISKQSTASDPSMTSTQAIMGTPMYMSPEQMRSSKSVDARSDIWALGMVLYELLVGRVAFARETLPELCAAILNDPPPSLLEARPDIGGELEVVVMRALEKSPAHRFGSLAEMASALAPFAHAGDEAERRIHRILGGGVPHVSETPPALAASTQRIVVVAPAAAESELHDRAERDPAPRRRLGLFVAIAAASLAVAGALILASLGGRRLLAHPPSVDVTPAASVVPVVAAPTPEPLPIPIVPAPAAEAGLPSHPSDRVADLGPTPQAARPKPPAPRARVGASSSLTNADDLGPRK